MTEITASTHPSAGRRPVAVSLVLAVVSASVVAALLCLLVAAGAHAAGASSAMLALTPAIFVPFIVVGVLAGAIGWSIIRARSRRPAAVLRRLVPVVLLVSLVPDVLVGVSRAMPGTSWTGVIGLMTMHVVVAACAVLAYRIFLPVTR
jgi:hypothetical protein